MRILMLEDDLVLSQLVSAYLSHHFIVDAVSTLQEAKDHIDQMNYDIVLLDRNINGLDIGMELIDTVKEKNSHTGVIVISAYDTTKDKVMGLNLGADDYLDKPFDNSELLARISALSRRNQPNKSFKIEDLEVDLQSQTVYHGEHKIPFTKKESDLIFYLLQHRGEIISKEALLHALYLHPQEISSNTIDATIKNIRKKLPTNIITTIKTRGYSVD